MIRPEGYMPSIIGREFVVFGLFLIVAVLAAACGGDGNGNGNGAAPPTAKLALFAGNLGGLGNSDGVREDARFFDPQGVATDSDGNVYVTDAFNFTIRKITPDGTVSTIAGLAGVSGSADGAGADARFSHLSGIAIDSAGNLFVADGFNHTIRKITPDGEVTTLAGSAGMRGSADGSGAAARFNFPEGVATDSAGNIYVADKLNETIRKVTPAGVVTTLAGSAGVTGSADGNGAAARFSHPLGVATDGADNLYVADSSNTTIRKITPDGTVSTIAGLAGAAGDVDGTGADARFGFPVGVATDSAGNVYVADQGNSWIRKITPGGQVTTLAGTGGDAPFSHPSSVAADPAGNVYVADAGNNRIRKIAPGGIVTTLAGAARSYGSTDGIGAAARFNSPGDVATDSAGNVYVADTGNHTIRKITPAGEVYTLAGRAGEAGWVDGPGAVARFNAPTDIATDNAGNVYVADTGNNRIRKIDAAGLVSTLAGTGAIGSADGNGDVATFGICYQPPCYPGQVCQPKECLPGGVATDSDGNVYVADRSNHTIRKVTPAGVVTTLAGMAGDWGTRDGNGSDARFYYPHDVATDSAGNVYVLDSYQTVRKVTPAGEVTTLAGSADMRGSADGMGAQARFNNPLRLATDSAGNVYVADWGNDAIRRIDPTGSVTTVVGVVGRKGFTPGTLPGVLMSPGGVAVRDRTLYVTFYNGVAVVTNLP